VEVVASLSQGRTAAAKCGLFTHKSVPVIFEPPCMFNCWDVFINKSALKLVTYAPVCGVSESLICVLCRRGKHYFCIISLFRNIVLIICSLYFITYRARC